MCGLSGCAGDVVLKDENAMKQLLYMNALRGTDSTGTAVQSRSHKEGELLDPDIYKLPVPSWVLMDTKSWDALFKFQNRLVMNHNRSATIGPKTTAYAQPYQFEYITGTHNGTVPLYDLKDMPNHKGAVSDSRTILEAIELLGVGEVIPKIEANDTNAWALVWYDIRDDSINFLRNSKRSLYYAFNEEHTVLYWASEVEMLSSVLNRNDIKRKEGEKAYVFNENTYYKWIIPKIREAFSEPTKVKIEGKPKASYVSYSGSEWRGEYKHNQGNKSELPFPQIEEKLKNSSIIPASDGSGNSSTVTNVTPINAQTKEKLAGGKDKFPLIFRSDYIRVYYDYNVESFHKYWWNLKHRHWVHSECTEDKKPLELIGLDINRLLRDKLTHVGTVQSFNLIAPQNDPDIDLTKETMRYKGYNFRVTKKKDKNDPRRWVQYFWGKATSTWQRFDDSIPPPSLTDTQLDINAHHIFHHTGKKENKVIKYKGFKDKEKNQIELLTMGDFNEITSGGCIGCGRTSMWNPGRRGGVKVEFVSPKEFLCEYCSEDSVTTEYLKTLARQKASSEGSATVN